MLHTLLLLVLAPALPMVASDPSPCRFDPDRSAALEVRRARSGHLLVRAAVDEATPAWFVLDSASQSHVLDLDLASDLGLEPGATALFRGVSRDLTLCSEWRARRLQVGPVSLSGPCFLGLDLASLRRRLGVKVAGILGAPLFARVVVELDHGAPGVALHDPERFVLRRGAWQGLLVYRGAPCVRARLEGQEGIFRIDTGAAREAVTVHAPSTDAWELRTGRRTWTRRIEGAAGGTRLDECRVEAFQLAGRVFPDLTVGLAREDAGALADPNLDGNIGGRLLEPFTLVLDVKNRRAAWIVRDASEQVLPSYPAVRGPPNRGPARIP